MNHHKFVVRRTAAWLSKSGGRRYSYVLSVFGGLGPVCALPAAAVALFTFAFCIHIWPKTLLQGPTAELEYPSSEHLGLWFAFLQQLLPAPHPAAASANFFSFVTS